MPVRMKDIAEDLGVSLMTVSKALRGHTDISEETRERIARRARALHYQPNWIARSLATRRTYIVGLVIPDLMHSFFAEVANGLGLGLGAFGYQILVANSNENPATERSEMEALLARSVDGLVVASAAADWKHSIPTALKTNQTPYVLIDRMPPHTNVNYVGTRDEDVGELATNHLLNQGCARIAHIRGPETPNSLRRLEGFRHALEQSRMPYRAEYVAVGGSDDEAGYRAMRQLLGLKRPPDGVFCYNDPVGAGALKAVIERGLRIPDDIALIGAGNVRYFDLLRVPLSTIDQGSAIIGETAAKILLQAMGKKTTPAPQCVLLPPRLIVRDSSRRKHDAH